MEKSDIMHETQNESSESEKRKAIIRQVTLREFDKDQNQKEQDVSLRDLVDFPSTTYSTFGIYNYPAKFIPHVVNYVLENYGEEGMTVFDPFAGCGTVGLASRIYGHGYELWDLNPILELLHRVAIAAPVNIDIVSLVDHVLEYEESYIPKWSNFDYWFAEDLQNLLAQSWGFYHALEDESVRDFLAVPLLKVSRHFSYDDMGRMKLSKSPKSKARVKEILKQDWKWLFRSMLIDELNDLHKKQKEYQSLNPVDVEATIRAGVDSLKESLREDRDILITSPPYLQSQEYMRQAKMDLFWLGYSDKEVKQLSKMEIPYRDLHEIDIKSETYRRVRKVIGEEHIQDVYDNYFRGVTQCLERLSTDISTYLFFFVGRSSMRGRPVPIDTILTEHFTQLGWTHERTLVDTIVSRRMFSYGVNPATNQRDVRTKTEHLIVLKRP
ncbi:MAG: hypothetical protein EAX81_03915 [Candidatus Thorarchaeota archaeon]|nr:hypothetical protein [Candidatus Thorarchaeota archaeon]